MLTLYKHFFLSDQFVTLWIRIRMPWRLTRIQDPYPLYNICGSTWLIRRNWAAVWRRWDFIFSILFLSENLSSMTIFFWLFSQDKTFLGHSLLESLEVHPAPKYPKWQRHVCSRSYRTPQGVNCRLHKRTKCYMYSIEEVWKQKPRQTVVVVLWGKIAAHMASIKTV